VLLPPGKLNRPQQAGACRAGILFKNVSCCYFNLGEIGFSVI